MSLNLLIVFVEEAKRLSDVELFDDAIRSLANGLCCRDIPIKHRMYLDNALHGLIQEKIRRSQPRT